ncbi:transcriptional regulator [Myroides sp. N17-2]|uniref:helix-turn-helix transcriptional regulator n=1 Tax=Myroides sp. N17-2 TaxID=2030799 RepID=UPI000EFAEDF3|nr:transcriptional regulator [Myroides sp. N17-2]
MKAKEIQVTEIWNDNKKANIKEAILAHAKTQSKEQILTNKLLAIQYRLEDYIESDTNLEVLKILDFVKMYLEVLNLTKKELATCFEMQDSNLHKYLNGERKLNATLVLKLSAFFHTPPELWYRIEVKNELIELNKEKENIASYQKYDYRNLVEM